MNTSHPKIIIMGTHHTLQCGVEPYNYNNIEIYKKKITYLCKLHGINLIAEEMCNNGLLYHEVCETVAAKLVTEKLGIAHYYIDIPFEGRELLNIGNSSIRNFCDIEFSKPQTAKNKTEQFRNLISGPLRELYWFAKLLSINTWPALFICGDNHVKNMCTLFHEVDDKAWIFDISLDEI